MKRELTAHEQLDLLRQGKDVSRAELRTLRVLYGHTRTGLAILRLRKGWKMPDCESPVQRVLEEYAKDVHWTVEPAGSITIYVPCRKCAKCLRKRANRWAARMHREIEAHPRTWVVRLSYKSEPTGLAPYKDVQDWLKRLRKLHDFRFCAVLEKGEQFGRQHWHVLIHGGPKLLKKHVRSRWGHGHTHAKLADRGAPRYLTKYVAKGLLRVRASLRYGKPIKSETDGGEGKTATSLP